MIDTIRLRYPLTEPIAERLYKRQTVMQRVSPSGEIEWQKGFVQQALPSHFEGLRITTMTPRETAKNGWRFLEPSVFFEFSLQKWLSESGYNNRNTDIDFDLQGMRLWVAVLSDELDYLFDYNEFVPNRVDLAQNYELLNGSPLDYLRSLELRMSRHPNGENIDRYKNTVFYGSRYMSKKIYWKWGEFKDIELPKRRGKYNDGYLETGVPTVYIEPHKYPEKRGLTFEELQQMKKILRFEIGYKRMKLKHDGINNIDAIKGLVVDFEEQRKRYLTVQRLREGHGLTGSQYEVIDLVKRYGLQGAKLEYMKHRTERAWRKARSKIEERGIFLESVINEEYRAEIEAVDNVADYVLKLAA